jgi:GNAT superfamily N-acetyltransferase
MAGAPVTYKLNRRGDPALSKMADRGLTAHNKVYSGPANYNYFTLSARNAKGKVIGVLDAYGFYGWLFVRYLWVDGRYRRGEQRVGSELMDRAEAYAKRCCYYGIWLDTFEFQARPFYEKRGFTLFGELKDNPPGYSRYFMQKMIGMPPKGRRRVLGARSKTQ